MTRDAMMSKHVRTLKNKRQENCKPLSTNQSPNSGFNVLNNESSSHKTLPKLFDTRNPPPPPPQDLPHVPSQTWTKMDE